MGVSDEVGAAWGRVDGWLERKAKRIRKRLAAGASEDEIRALEREAGVRLPEDLRAFYRIHNGADDAPLFPSSQTDEAGYSPLPLVAILEERGAEDPAMDQYATPDAGVQARHWHAGWVPFAANGGGDFLCVDLAPGAGGTAGQVIEVLHETGERKRVAASFAQYLSELADGLESGRLKYDSEDGIHRPTPRPTPEQRLAELERRILEADLARIDKDRPRKPSIEVEKRIARPFDRIDKDRRYFGPSCDDYYDVIAEMIPIGNTSLFYDHFAPRQRVAVNGYVLLPIPEILEATRPHYLKHRNVVVFGRTPDGERLYFDALKYSHEDGLVPVMRIPADLDLTRATAKKLAGAAQRLAPNIVTFFTEHVLGKGTPRVEAVSV